MQALAQGRGAFGEKAVPERQAFHFGEFVPEKFLFESHVVQDQAMAFGIRVHLAGKNGEAVALDQPVRKLFLPGPDVMDRVSLRHHHEFDEIMGVRRHLRPLELPGNAEREVRFGEKTIRQILFHGLSRLC